MSDLVPGELLVDDEPVELNAGRETATVTVENTGDRPVQVGSHYHFFETNPALEFDRVDAYGMRLNVPAGTAVRFEPGAQREVDLVAIGGRRIVHGHGGLVEGELDDDEVRDRAFERAAERGYAGIESTGGADESSRGTDESSRGTDESSRGTDESARGADE